MGTATLIPLLAGGLVAVAGAGSLVADSLWLALVPAAILLIPAVRVLRDPHGEQFPALGVLGSFLLQASCACSLVLAAVGALVEMRVGIEPRWLSVLVTWSGTAFLLGAFLFGAGIFKARVLPGPAALVFALSLPLGFAFDLGADFVPGFFLSGAGFYLGFGLFALALIRLGWPSGTGMSKPPDHPGGQSRRL